jgi:hypothetical protein
MRIALRRATEDMGMKAKVRILLERCIEYGTERGYRRAFKHTDSPSEAHIISEIDAAIWLEIDTYFDFENNND